MLWLAVHLPHLSLDRLRRGLRPGDAGVPLAVFDTAGGRPWIHARNRAAAAAGITPGMALGEAMALCGQLRPLARNRDEEAETLKSLAAWAGQFTPQVSLQAPNGLLLEVAASLSLFGGIESLRTRLARGLRELGYRARLAVAPTPLGAWLLARAGHGEPVADRVQLASLLRRLPIEQLERPQALIDRLHGMGLYRVGDCLRQPRAGLAKRLGPEFLQYLDRALGRLPDPRPPYQPPATFESRLNLPAEVDGTDALLFAARRLLLELTGFLRARGRGVQQMRLELLHAKPPADTIELGLVRPTRNPDHLLRLLRERLDRHTLTAPVDGLVLRAAQLVPLAHRGRNLFDDKEKEGQDWPELVEHLRARLGQGAVTGLYPAADHRPERAWRFHENGRGAAATGAERPIWLLETPQPLHDTQGFPWFGGRLVLTRGPERIESGWWDGDDAARDYFIAENVHRERFWIYRERRPPSRWFLHGIFG